MSDAGATPAPLARGAFHGVTKLFNKLVLPLAGTRLVPLYGLLEHRGRRSGRTFRTPVVVLPTAAGFIVPMPWGEGTDWYRNVRAAGGCTVRWKARDYPMTDPVVVDPAAVAESLGGFQRAAMRRFGIRQCLRLSHRR